MKEKEFEDLAKAKIKENYYKDSDIEICKVWYCYIAGNRKALYIAIAPDTYYYEVTYLYHLNKFIIDKYKKTEQLTYDCPGID